MSDCLRLRTAFITIVIIMTSLSPGAVAVAGIGDAEEELSFFALEEQMMVTVATKTKTTVQEAPSIVSVITGEQIRNMGARSIVDVLRTVPGFDMTQIDNMPLHQINIRGMKSAFDNGTVKIMLNGHSMQAAYNSLYAHIDILPIKNIRKVEIIRGPGSALYGTGAFTGVINIITEEGGEGASEISVAGGSSETFKSYGKVSYKKDKLKLALYADAYKTDGYHATIESDMASGSSIFCSKVPGKTTDGRDYQTLNANIKYGNLYFDGFFQQLNSENYIGAARILTDEDDIDQMYAYGELGYNFMITDKANVNVRVYYDYFKFDHLFELFPEETAEMPIHAGFPPGEGLYGEPVGKMSVSGAEIMADFEAYPGIKIVSGTTYEYFRQWDIEHYSNYNLTGHELVLNGIPIPKFPYQYLGGMIDLGEEGIYSENTGRTVYAFYGQSIFDLKQLFSLEKGARTLALTAGVRYDHYDDFGSTTNPRLGLVYAPTEKLYFKLLYGTAFRAPSWREMYVKNNPSMLGNKELDPEAISTTEGLVGFNFAENITSTLTFFNIRGDDMIRINPVNKTYENIGELGSTGAEFEIRYMVDKRNYAYFNATYQDVKDTTGLTTTSAGGQVYIQEDFNPGGVPNFMANIGVNFDVTRYANANVWLNYVGERDRSEEKNGTGRNWCSLIKDSLWTSVISSMLR